MPPLKTPLSPRQQETFLQLSQGRSGRTHVVHGRRGSGKSTLLEGAHETYGGVLLNARDLMEGHLGRHPLEIEESIYRVVRDALDQHETVILDDFHELNNLLGCHFYYPRLGFYRLPLLALSRLARERDRRFILAMDAAAPGPLHRTCEYFGIERFQVDDYRFFGRTFLGAGNASTLDFDRIYRFAPRLDAYDWKGAGQAWWRRLESVEPGTPADTDEFIEFLRSQRLASNVDLGEVQQVDLRDLKGVENVLDSLEANIILPLENDDVARELGIRPKRGVLLAGPPGTGKTTVGRALAHRLRGKFFLVDGTIISGTSDFYNQISRIFEAAKDNAPSVIFIDDSDVIFESGEEMGLYRYLLTMLDGLESESAARICVMMTAMDIGSLPPALVRSGRIELWLEMTLPGEAARLAILQERLTELPVALADVDVARLASATEGFTGADLKRLVEDGKVLYAYDRVRGHEIRKPTEYFLAAIESVRENKERYSQAEARARKQHPSRPPWFSEAAMRAYGGDDGDDDD